MWPDSTAGHPSAVILACPATQNDGIGYGIRLKVTEFKVVHPLLILFKVPCPLTIEWE